MVVEKWDIIKIAEEGQSTAISLSPSKHVCNASVYCLVWKLYLNIEISPIFHTTDCMKVLYWVEKEEERFGDRCSFGPSSPKAEILIFSCL